MTADDHLAMMKTVQPFIDTAISKTVNVPADYPYDSFKDLYFQAWKSNLKGLATYRPNNILGAVLEEVKPESGSSNEVHEAHKNELLPISKKVIEKRPNGELPAVAEKISYWTQDGKKTLYLIISFMAVEGVVNGQKCLEERAIEFFMPVGQSGESQQWITSSMRLLSLAARGGFLSRALSDMRKVVWDRGPVRLGTKLKLDGTEVPMWHDSEVAAVAYAIEKILQRRKISEFGADLNGELMEVSSSNVISGRKCSDCGAHTLIKKDGCDYCTSCGFVGSCG
jgi:ribonucleoside-diphosphate reductase alpha chain